MFFACAKAGRLKESLRNPDPPVVPLVFRGSENTKIPVLVGCAVRTIAVNTTMIGAVPVMCAQRTLLKKKGNYSHPLFTISDCTG